MRSTAAPRQAGSVAVALSLSTLLFAVACCLLAGSLPVTVSIAAVFLFAGPHNWIEARYFLTRLPARAGRLWPYFLVSSAGVVGLTVVYAAITWFAPRLLTSPTAWQVLLACWNTLLIAWVATLIHLRSRQPPRRDWSVVLPSACIAIALAWTAPQLCMFSLVYLHPFIGLWILDREIARSRPEWTAGYRGSLCLLPVMLALLWAQLANRPAISIDDLVTARIVEHSGGPLLNVFPNRALVATHTFLELIHYGVWLLAIPVASGKTWSLGLSSIPLARRSAAWKKCVATVLAISALAVVCLWVGFWIDYVTARDIYFTIAILHVLAEIPFLLRSL